MQGDQKGSNITGVTPERVKEQNERHSFTLMAYRIRYWWNTQNDQRYHKEDGCKECLYEPNRLETYEGGLKIKT